MDQRLGKKCIFCGKTAEEKTKEHVIPQWLMKLTGDPKRQTYFFSFRPHDDPGRYRELAFDNIHFPACSKCNNDFANLESAAKVVVEKILAKAAISQSEWVVLLDWLDKVRVGVWLGTRYMDKNYVSVDPHFYINDRVGTKDRSVIILRAPDDQRLSVFGTNSLAFRYMPSCWGIVINNVVLVNVSHEFLLARRLGFPYADDVQLHDSGLSSYISVPGRERVMRPPLILPVVSHGTAIHQCIYKDWERSIQKELWESDYVISNTIDRERGLSRLFIENESGWCAPYPDIDTSDWLPKCQFKETVDVAQHALKICFDLQVKLLDFFTIGVRNGEGKRLARLACSKLRKELKVMQKAAAKLRL